MRFHSQGVATALSVLALGASSATHAALIDRGGGLIYDTDLDITWLSDASASGFIDWYDAITWAANFSYYDGVRDVTYTDWRLPKADTVCGIAYNCTGSEMGHLFYVELGGVAGQSITTTHNSNYSLFQNIQIDGYHWTGNEYDFSDAWGFYFGLGGQNYDMKTYSDYYAWAVRDGDVAGMSAVPIPAAFWLFGSGLLGLIGVARRRAA
jgi:hypothetical protein